MEDIRSVGHYGSGEEPCSLRVDSRPQRRCGPTSPSQRDRVAKANLRDGVDHAVEAVTARVHQTDLEASVSQELH
jgi:hypothetical protein